ncbi:hypothetical protein F442_18014 [Phytophthora nicotianae P10297]|uniref:Succinate dehydrogenase assembly factor 4, mitochondrial n=2 Tax=Phytophthora nicotianae TaxID=4792 RepID=W2YFM6_PHYNI|nr:hypothetical protein F444_18197 [Phytophthora nicotianae P1976]ETP33448.1 hypothetical protein F442_18014 [Phytophthora nicotianae P10297]
MMLLRRVVCLAAGSRRALASMPTTVTVSKATAQVRLFSGGSGDANFVALHPSGKPHITNTPAAPVSNDLDDLEDLDDDDAEETVVIGPSGAEYGGPTRGGKLKEPTRFGDWERKGRCSDF